MKVTVTKAGGLAGLVETLAVDSDELDDPTTAELTTKVEAVLSEEASSPTSVIPDEAVCEITVEDQDERRALAYSELDMPGPMIELVDWVSTLSQAERSIESPGSTT